MRDCFELKAHQRALLTGQLLAMLGQKQRKGQATSRCLPTCGVQSVPSPYVPRADHCSDQWLCGGTPKVRSAYILYKIKKSHKTNFYQVLAYLDKFQEKTIKRTKIISVSSSDHSYLQFTFDFIILTQSFNISYFEQKKVLTW